MYKVNSIACSYTVSRNIFFTFLIIVAVIMPCAVWVFGNVTTSLIQLGPNVHLQHLANTLNDITKLKINCF